MNASVTASSQEWNAHLARFSPQYRDIYFTYGWHDLFARDIGAEPRAFLFEGTRGTRVLYPFLLRKIPERFSPSPLFACESAYGYGGPLTEAPDPGDLAMADDAFCDWARANGIVAEFVRFHPLLDTHRWFRRDMLIEENRPTVTVPLDAPYERLFLRFSPAKRRNIRKADKAGVVVSCGEDFGGFWRLYEATMDRLDAAGFYHFPGEHRARLERLVRSSGFLLEARISGRLAGAALFLKSAGFLHFHLGGSDAALLGAAPNDRLMAEAIRLGVETGARAVHFGGGVTTAVDDTLLRFKKGFSPTLTLYRTGKRVHQPDRHDLFRTLWRKTAGVPPSRFLQYLDDI